MMQSKATTVAQYLAELPADRRAVVEAVRKVILRNLPKGYEEGMQYGMIGYHVPHSLYPEGYHCDPSKALPYAGLAAQKSTYSLYLTCLYSDLEQLEWFQQAWRTTGRKLDMGKGCVRFKRLEDVPLDVVGQAIKRVPVKQFIAHYDATVRPTKKGSTRARGRVTGKPAEVKAAADKATTRATSARRKSTARKRSATKRAKA